MTYIYSWVAAALCLDGNRDKEDNRQDGGLSLMAKRCLCPACQLYAKKRAPQVRRPFVRNTRVGDYG